MILGDCEVCIRQRILRYIVSRVEDNYVLVLASTT